MVDLFKYTYPGLINNIYDADKFSLVFAASTSRNAAGLYEFLESLHNEKKKELIISHKTNYGCHVASADIFLNFFMFLHQLLKFSTFTITFACSLFNYEQKMYGKMSKKRENLRKFARRKFVRTILNDKRPERERDGELSNACRRSCRQRCRRK